MNMAGHDMKTKKTSKAATRNVNNMQLCVSMCLACMDWLGWLRGEKKKGEKKSSIISFVLFCRLQCQNN